MVGRGEVDEVEERRSSERDMVEVRRGGKSSAELLDELS